LELLSEREREVLELIALGYTQKEVAQRLRINRKSVETYRGRIATKLNLSSRADMVQFAFAAGVV
jgi:two-component system response regulator NreC